MAVNAENKMQGSIGGGIMEHKFVEMAKEKLQVVTLRLANADKPQIRKQIHDKVAGKTKAG